MIDFLRSESLIATDLNFFKGVFMIDFHAHILPGVDHGSTSLKNSLSQLDLAADAGVKTIVSTSHFYPHYHTVDKFLEKRNSAFKELFGETKESHPKIILAAEVLVCEGLEKLPILESLAIADSGYILLEIPFNNCSSEIVDTVRRINSNPNTKVILAHADRYSSKYVEEFLEFGAKIQLNATAFTGFFTPAHIKSYLDRDLVVALGSDIHGADPKAYKYYLKAKKKLGAHYDRIMQHSMKILAES